MHPTLAMMIPFADRAYLYPPVIASKHPHGLPAEAVSATRILYH